MAGVARVAGVGQREQECYFRGVRRACYLPRLEERLRVLYHVVTLGVVGLGGIVCSAGCADHGAISQRV